MIKNLFVLFFISAQFFFSQKYHFDYFVEEISKSTFGSPKNHNERKVNFFYDSTNDLKLWLQDSNNGLYGSIYDEDKKKMHYFNVEIKNEKLSFTYDYSQDFNVRNVSSIKDLNKRNQIDVEKIDSLHYSVNIFLNEKRKRKKYQIEVVLEKSPVNFFELPIEYSRCKEVIQKIKNLLPKEQKFLIKNSKLKNEQPSDVYENEISKFEKVNLIIELPEKLNLIDLDKVKNAEILLTL